jgi:antitoxin YqcF
MSSISEEDRAIAKAAAEAFGGRPRVTRFWDDNHVSSIDILRCEDRPQEGITTYSTVGLSGWPLFKGEKEYGCRLEIVGACRSSFEGFANALSTAAFCVINSRWFCCPGMIFPDVLTMYDSSPTLQHFLFVSPFLWEGTLNTIDRGGHTVAWLLAVPISEEERMFAEENGTERLERLFVDRQIDIFNLHRRSEV